MTHSLSLAADLKEKELALKSAEEKVERLELSEFSLHSYHLIRAALTRGVYSYVNCSRVGHFKALHKKLYGNASLTPSSLLPTTNNNE